MLGIDSWPPTDFSNVNNIQFKQLLILLLLLLYLLLLYYWKSYQPNLFDVIMTYQIRLVNMQNFEKGHLSFRMSNFFLFFMGGWKPSCPQLKIYNRICSICSTADITVIQSSKLSTLRSTFGRVPLNFFNCSGWNYFNFYIYFLISAF